MRRFGRWELKPREPSPHMEVLARGGKESAARPMLMAGVLLLLAVALSLSACGKEADSPARPSYLDPYKPLLKEWTPADEAEWESFPRATITATLNLEERIIEGVEVVRFVNREKNPLWEIYFRLYPNLPQYGGSIAVSKVSAGGQLLPAELDIADTALRIPCDPPIQPGQRATFTLHFRTVYPEVADGWVLFGRSQSILSLPNFYPSLAVHNEQGWHLSLPPAYADAGFSEIGFFDVWLTLPADQVVAGTGMVVEEVGAEAGMKTVHLRAGPAREFVFLASSDFQTLTAEACGAQLHSFFLREDAAAGRDVLWQAGSALCVYQDMYGPYPFTVMNVVEAPLTYHGMEFSSLNLLGIDLYRRHRDDLRYLTVHEVAHQWWYAQVGSDPYDAPWLDEGLAEYSAYTYFWKVKGREVAENLRAARWAPPVEYARSTGEDAPLAQPADAFKGPLHYETMVYAKSALFFDALRRAVGDEAYYALLQEYVQRYRFRLAVPGDFFSVAQEVSGRDISPLVREWVLSGSPAGENAAP